MKRTKEQNDALRNVMGHRSYRVNKRRLARCKVRKVERFWDSLMEVARRNFDSLPSSTWWEFSPDTETGATP